MDTLSDDLSRLEEAMRKFVQTVKRPHYWTLVTERAGTHIDRPSAVILHFLLMHDGSTGRLHDLAEQLGVEAPSITRKTQELERAGYLKRVPDRQDRRIISLQVTAAGQAVSSRIWKEQRAIISQALGSWPAAERRQFVAALEHFADDLTAVAAATITSKRKGA